MKLFRGLCAFILVLLIAACGEPAIAPQPEATAVPQEANAPVEEEPDVVVIVTQTPTEIPAEAPTEAPEEAPTEEPAPTSESTPEPAKASETTRAPREGDIAVNFPDYDTGVDADYSYQSDELKIAITVHQGNLRDERMNRDLMSTWYVVDIWVRNINSMHTLFGNGVFQTGSEYGQNIAVRENAVLAINGSYNQGLVLCKGKVLQKLRENKGWNSGAVGLIYADGSLKTFHLKTESFDVNKEVKNGAVYGWQFGPIIIRDGEQGPGALSYSNMGYKARNILGYYEPGHYVVVYCDNQHKNANGMDAQMMVNMMKSLGVKEAFNLDGGTSSVLVFMGEVINQPTTEKKGGKILYGRPLVDMFGFGEYDETTDAFVDLSTLTASKFLGKN